MAPVRTTSKIAELARNFIDTTSTEGQKGWLERISEVISTRKSTGLLELVEELGTYLTSVEVQQRRKASRLLAELMHRSVFHFLYIQTTSYRDAGDGAEGSSYPLPFFLAAWGAKVPFLKYNSLLFKRPVYIMWHVHPSWLRHCQTGQFA